MFVVVVVVVVVVIVVAAVVVVVTQKLNKNARKSKFRKTCLSYQIVTR